MLSKIKGESMKPGTRQIDNASALFEPSGATILQQKCTIDNEAMSAAVTDVPPNTKLGVRS